MDIVGCKLMYELKRCPFCGSDEVSVIQARMYFVMCNQCGGEGGMRATINDAMKAWNDRMADPRLEDDGK